MEFVQIRKRHFFSIGEKTGYEESIISIYGKTEIPTPFSTSPVITSKIKKSAFYNSLSTDMNSLSSHSFTFQFLV